MTTPRTHRFRALFAAPLVAVLSLGVVACGGDDDGGATTTVDDGAWDDARLEQERQDARALLGMNEADLGDDVRIARRGDEQFALTMDLVPGRHTVELDDDGSGFRVVSVSLETPDGSETFDLEPS